jgi:UDP-glucuronate decarboxylase
MLKSEELVQGKRILVSGGAGFLGSHLVERLLDLGNQVVVVDNFFTGNSSNLSHVVNNSNLKVINHDVTESIFIEVDEIYNLACPASPEKYQINPVQTLKTNVVGAINMLDLAKQLNIRILQASTSEIYGDPMVSPQYESYWGNVNPVGIRSCYDEGKRAAETLFSDYHRQYNTDIRVARIFNTYGPRMNVFDGRVVSNFVVQALKNLPLTVYGDGSQVRSLCYVDDLIDGFLRLMAKNGLHQPVNLGNPEPITILELAKNIITKTNSDSKIEFRDLPADDPKTREPDISRAKSELGWSPKFNRDRGLELTIDYFRKVLGSQ